MSLPGRPEVESRRAQHDGTPVGPPPPAPVSAPRVMLLSLWVSADAGWHVRLQEPDAQEHVFDSPFELARFLARWLAQPGRPPGPSPGGLR